jgi:hypothetical protein
MHGQTLFGSLNVKYKTLATRLGPDKQHLKFIGQQSVTPQHFMQVNRLHAGVAVSPSVVPLLAGYEHEQPVEQVPLPPEILIHFCNSARHCHVHEPVQGCSVVVVVVVDDVLLVVVDDVVVPVLVVVVVVGGAVLVVLVDVDVVLVDVVVGEDWHATNTCSLKYAPGLDG